MREPSEEEKALASMAVGDFFIGVLHLDRGAKLNTEGGKILEAEIAAALAKYGDEMCERTHETYRRNK